MKIVLTEEELHEAVADYAVGKLQDPPDGKEWKYGAVIVLDSDGEAIDDTVEVEIEITAEDAGE